MIKVGDIVCYVTSYHIEFGRVVEIMAYKVYRIVPLKQGSIKRKKLKDLVSLEKFSEIVKKEQNKKSSKLLKKS